MSNVDQVLDQLFEVKAVPMIPEPQPGLNLEGPEGQYGIYRMDTGGQPLGLIGRNFNLIQPAFAVSEFMRCVEGINGVDMDSLQYHTMYNGARHFLTLKVAEFGFKNARKLGDITEVRLSLKWGYDGRTKWDLGLFDYRLVCLNGMVRKNQGARVKFKNYKDNAKKLEFACEQFQQVIAQAEDMKSLAKQMDRVQIMQKDIEDAMSRVFDVNWAKGLTADGKKAISPAKMDTLNAALESINLEIDRTGSTAWGLLNGFTHFASHRGTFQRPGQEKDVEDRTAYLVDGQGAEINARAQEAVMALLS
jgi:hypothetical protein